MGNGAKAEAVQRQPDGAGPAPTAPPKPPGWGDARGGRLLCGRSSGRAASRGRPGKPRLPGSSSWRCRPS